MPILAAGLSSNGFRVREKEKSGGFRTLIAYRIGDLAVFMYGFAKNDRD